MNRSIGVEVAIALGLIVVFSLFGHAQAASQEVRDLNRQVIDLENKSGAFDRYMIDYYSGFPVSHARVANCDRVFGDLLKSRFLFIGDEHAEAYPVDFMIRAVNELARQGESPVLVIEFIFARQQLIIDEYLNGRISLSDVRRLVGFDSFGWGWKWESISRVLEIGKTLGLRVLAGEQGQGDLSNIEERNEFTAEVIRQDTLTHHGSKYVILYGAFHVVGGLSTPSKLALKGLTSQSVATPLLGRVTETVVDAAGHASEDAHCLRFRGGLYFISPLTVKNALRAYLQGMIEDQNSNSIVTRE